MGDEPYAGLDIDAPEDNPNPSAAFADWDD